MNTKLCTHALLLCFILPVMLLVPVPRYICIAAAADQVKPAFEHGDRALGIPFQMAAQHIILNVMINDSVNADLIFDTGFGVPGAILFDPAIGEKLGLDYAGAADLGGGGTEGAKLADVAVDNTFSLPGVSLPGQQLLVFQRFDSVFSALSPDGIIGAALMEFIVEIDYEESVLNLYDRETYRPDTSAVEFPLIFSYGIPVIEAEVEIEEHETMPLTLLFDTGTADIPLLLFPFSDERIQRPDKTVEIQGEAMGGNMVIQCGRIASLKVGPFTFESVVAGFVDEESFGEAVVLGQNGMLGHDTIERFTVTLDYGGQRLYLKPGRSYEREYEINMAGIQLMPLKDGRLRVQDVIPDSPAAREGLRKGDLVMEINGHDVREMDFREQRRLFSRPDTTVNLILMRDSQTLNHTLALERLL